MTEGQARVYCRPRGARGAGHVGWAFVLPDGTWEVGAVERGGLLTPPIADGYWSSVMLDPDPHMRGLRYDYYKQIEVAIPTVAPARAAEEQISRRWFNLVIHNCMQDTNTVLTAYGAVLPPVGWRSNWRPTTGSAPCPATSSGCDPGGSGGSCAS